MVRIGGRTRVRVRVRVRVRGTMPPGVGLLGMPPPIPPPIPGPIPAPIPGPIPGPIPDAIEGPEGPFPSICLGEVYG